MADNNNDTSPPARAEVSQAAGAEQTDTARATASSGNGGKDTQAESLNIKVTDNNNEVFFKIKRNTKLEKLMTAFCERQGKELVKVRFLFEGQRVQPTDTPDTLEMQDGDTLEVHQEQVGGLCNSWVLKTA